MLRVVARLWAYGVKAYSDRDLGVPIATAEGQQYDPHPLDHPAHSPVAGLESLARYMQAAIAPSPPSIIHFCGTHDVLHPGNVRLHQRLLALGPTIVKTEFHSVSLSISSPRELPMLRERPKQFPGLFHVFQGLDFLPESKKVWHTVKRILS